MPTLYFKLPPRKIVEDIIRSDRPKKIQIQEMTFVVYPNVYPSDKFRTTNLILDSIKPFIPGLTVCDMGC